MKTDFHALIDETFSGLSERDKGIITRRFGLGQEKQTLQAIGDIYGLTRERIRQIQDSAIEKIEPKINKMSFVGELSRRAKEILGKLKVKREKTFLNSIGKTYGLTDNDLNSIHFLLVLHKKLGYYSEDNDVYGFWSDERERINLAKHMLAKIYRMLLKKPDKLWQAEEILGVIEQDIRKHLQVKGSLGREEIEDFLRILKSVGKNPRQEFGVLTHPQISPSSLDDKILFVFESKKEPMHFSEIYNSLIELAKIEDEFLSQRWRKDYNKQSVQNLLIANPQFVWIGRGTYGLKKWGYCEGAIFERMRELVKKHKKIHKDKLRELLGQERKFSPITFEAYLKNRANFKIVNDMVNLSQ